MTPEQIISRLKYIEKELDEIKIDIIDIKSQLSKVVDIDTEIQLKVKNRKGTKWEIYRVVGLTIIVITFLVWTYIAFINIDKKIDNISTPTGIVRGNQFIPFPSDSKIVRWPDNYDTVKVEK
jgi:hypothetical protein